MLLIKIIYIQYLCTIIYVHLYLPICQSRIETENLENTSKICLRISGGAQLSFDKDGSIPDGQGCGSVVKYESGVVKG